MNLPFWRKQAGQLKREHFRHDLSFFPCMGMRGYVIFHSVEMKDTVAQLTALRKQLLQQMPELSTILPGSLLSRMVRCNKPGCRFCEKGKGTGHGPIWILSVSLGNRQVRQVPIPGELKKEVEESQRAFAQMQKVVKQIAQVNLELFKERKRQRP
jgi:hypothetical protein